MITCGEEKEKAPSPTALQYVAATSPSGAPRVAGSGWSDVRYAPQSSAKAVIAGGPGRAISGLIHRGRKRYSTTSSARTSNDTGITSPMSLAALLLMTSSNFVG